MFFFYIRTFLQKRKCIGFFAVFLLYTRSQKIKDGAERQKSSCYGWGGKERIWRVIRQGRRANFEGFTSVYAGKSFFIYAKQKWETLPDVLLLYTHVYTTAKNGIKKQ